MSTLQDSGEPRHLYELYITILTLQLGCCSIDISKSSSKSLLKTLVQHLVVGHGRLTSIYNTVAGEKLNLYLVASDLAISAMLVCNESKVQQLVYFVSQALHNVKLKYPPMEKLVYALVTSVGPT